MKTNNAPLTPEQRELYELRQDQIAAEAFLARLAECPNDEAEELRREFANSDKMSLWSDAPADDDDLP